MKIPALETDVPGVADSEFTDAPLKEEAARAWDLYQDGVIREFYFRADCSAAGLILECKTPEEAASILVTLPLVRKKMIAFEIVPLTAYPGLGRLFGEP